MDIRAKNQKKEIRKSRVRAKVVGVSERPRLSVFFSNNHIVAQIIDDSKGSTLVYKTDKHTAKEGKDIEVAKEVGKAVAEEATEKKIKKVVFDKGSKKYHGRVKALADSARDAGLEF